MKVLFINPPTSFEQIYGDWDLSALDTYTPPLGIMHLASYIREHGHDPHILDLQIGKWELDGVIDAVLALQPDVLGLSSMTINCLNAKRISDALRSRGFDAPIVLGGAHVTAVPNQTLEEFTTVNYAVLGEGEESFLDLLETLESDRPIGDVKGVAWRRSTGEVVINERRAFILELDQLPFPAWDLLDDFPRSYPSSLLESRRVPAAGIMTSRGCPFHCTFCDNTVFGTRVRHFSADYSLRMIHHLVENFQVRDLMIFDDNFLLDEGKLSEICNGIISDKLDLTWFCIAHAKSMKKERLVSARMAGCWFVEMGIESGNSGILKDIRKSTDKVEISEAATNAHEAGMLTKGNFIFGFPNDTKETIEETIQFSLDIDIDFFQQSFLTIWPGCEIFSQVNVESETMKEVRNDWSKLAHQRVTYVPPGLTESELIDLSKTAFRRFYLRPRIILQLLPLLLTLRGLKLFIVGLRVFVQTILRRR